MTFGPWIRRTGFWSLDALRGRPIRRHYDDVAARMTDGRPDTEALERLLEHATRTTPAYDRYAGQPLDAFPALRGVFILLIHPGFGIPTPWAYRELARFPAALPGRAGRAQRLVEQLRAGDLTGAVREFYNSLEAPALEKYPVLKLYQEFLLEHGALAALMSGSGSTTFALAPSRDRAEQLRETFQRRFGAAGWTALAQL